MERTMVPEKEERKKTAVPPLQNGDHLTRSEFERRYQEHDHVKKAELVEGVVHMPSPVLLNHGEIHSSVMIWLGMYRVHTRGVRLADNASVRLDIDNEVQPDAFLYVEPERGGQIVVGADGYVSGAPEMVVEVAASSAACDLHEKRHVYRRNEVREYLVLLAYEKETRWFRWEEGQYDLLTPNDFGILQSRIFPGLWLQSEAFWADDLETVLATLRKGLKTTAHAEFVEKLQTASD